MDTISALVQQYGYPVVFIGAFFEGETILAMGGFAAERGYLGLFEVILVGLCGGFMGDQFFFFLGRRHGPRLLARFPVLAQRATRVDELLARYHAPLIFSIRFMYGLRIVGPIVFGMGRVPAAKFFFFNLLGASVWAPLVAGAGYLFGQTLELVLSDMKHLELLGLGAIVVIGLLIWGVHRYRERAK